MRVLGFDLGGAKTGVAYVGADGDLEWARLWRLVSKRQESWGVRWLRLRRELERLGSDSLLQRVDLVTFEEVKRHRGTDAAHAYGAAKGVLLSWCEDVGIPYQGVTVADIKRVATGKGGGRGTGKPEMLAAARSRWPLVRFETDDVADAAFCALAASGEWAA